MTEQEMNLKVAEVFGFFSIEADRNDTSVECCHHEFDISNNYDWCNYDTDWGRLIEDNRIDIAHQDNGMVFAGAGKCSDDFYAHEATDKKIGVAVVKCFLMMNGVKL